MESRSARKLLCVELFRFHFGVCVWMSMLLLFGSVLYVFGLVDSRFELVQKLLAR